MTTQWFFNELGTITERNIQLLKNKFMKYSDNQLNWKPAATVWSINEVFAHLNAFANYYNRKFHERIDQTKFRTPRTQFVSSPLGKSAWVSMKLGNARNVKRKFKAQKDFNPSLNMELRTGNDVQLFLDSQLDFLKIIEKSVAVDLKRVKVPLSITNLIRLRLGDALLYVTYHNDRHMEQALNLTKHPQFPKK